MAGASQAMSIRGSMKRVEDSASMQAHAEEMGNAIVDFIGQ